MSSWFDSLPKPYQEYVLRHAPRNPAFRQFFIEVIECFNSDMNTAPVIGTIKSQISIQECINKFLKMPNHPYFVGQSINEHIIKDKVLVVLGFWTLMFKYYMPGRRKYRHILQAYCNQKRKAYNESIGLQTAFSTLISECGLLPHEAENRTKKSSNHTLARTDPNNTVTLTPFILHESFGVAESLCIEARNLNAFKLATLAGVHIRWTDNVSRHLLLSKNAQTFYLDLFSLPCALQGGLENDSNANQPIATLAPEILCSYSILFNPRRRPTWHRYLAPLIGLRFWCWCLCCSSDRLCQRELKKLKHDSRTETPYDDKLDSLVKQKPREWHSGTKTWDHNDFQRLWPRILALDSHLQKAKPWSFWVIFRDRRDTLQFWTFFFGTIILFLTFVQVGLGIAQVAGSFK